MIAPLLLCFLPLVQQDPASETAAIEPPMDVIPLLLEAAGGLEAWERLPGIRYDLLETGRLLDRTESPPHWEVHTHLPLLHHVDLRGNGYALAEYVNRRATGAKYRRLIYSEGATWTEQEGEWRRDIRATDQVLLRMRREFFLGTFPFSLPELGATSTFVREDPTGRSGRTVWVYRLDLKEGIRMQRTERVREFLLYVNPLTSRAIELRFRFVGDDRYHLGLPESWARILLLGEVSVAGIELPHKRIFKYDDSPKRTDWWTEDPRALPLPPEALRRPWHTGSLWQWTDRADFWDPPAADESGGEGAEARTGGDAAGGR